MTNEEKKAVAEQIVHVQNELAKLQNLLQDEPDDCPDASLGCLEVTQVKVFPFKEAYGTTVKALAQIVLNEQLVVRGLRVMDGVNGLFVSYPLDPFFKADDFRTICNPISRQLREHIETRVLDEYLHATA
jgi:stage V sporulation protein G